jgi:NitT/TauT family transport system ATP-binding protein
MASAPASLLHIEDVYKYYGPKIVLENIDLAASRGTFCSVVGPSGCGKSTLFRLILGEELPSSGAIAVDGAEVTAPGTDRGIVYQRYSLYPHLSVLENVMLGRNLRTGFMERLKHRAEFRDEAMKYLQRVRLAEHAQKYPHQLSGGMQQRVAIAQALINRPRILLMDEAFSALDSGTRREMQSLVRELWKATGTTVLFVTHNIDEALRLGTRVLVLAKEAPDQGSRLAMDLEVPDPCTEDAIPPLVLRLEQAS